MAKRAISTQKTEADEYLGTSYYISNKGETKSRGGREGRKNESRSALEENPSWRNGRGTRGV